ncbi:hypothetical protein DFH09DRAFT_1480914 [Mycena vulgaris]|nr:hypothetical protein DFH09DRAFT_1480914 [Mycena vulgaris]
MVPSSHSLAVERRRRTERGKKIGRIAYECKYQREQEQAQDAAPTHPSVLSPRRGSACAVFWWRVEIWAHAEPAHVRVLHRTLARPPGADLPIHARRQPHPTTHGLSAGANLGAGTDAAPRRAGARVQPLLHIARAPAALAAPSLDVGSDCAEGAVAAYLGLVVGLVGVPPVLLFLPLRRGRLRSYSPQGTHFGDRLDRALPTLPVGALSFSRLVYADYESSTDATPPPRPPAILSPSHDATGAQRISQRPCACDIPNRRRPQYCGSAPPSTPASTPRFTPGATLRASSRSGADSEARRARALLVRCAGFRVVGAVRLVGWGAQRALQCECGAGAGGADVRGAGDTTPAEKTVRCARGARRLRGTKSGRHLEQNEHHAATELESRRQERSSSMRTTSTTYTPFSLFSSPALPPSPPFSTPPPPLLLRGRLPDFASAPYTSVESARYSVTASPARLRPAPPALGRARAETGWAARRGSEHATPAGAHFAFRPGYGWGGGGADVGYDSEINEGVEPLPAPPYPPSYSLS